MRKLKQTFSLISASLILLMAFNVKAQTVASGSGSASSFFMCSLPGIPQGSGGNTDGQLGDATNVNKSFPTPVLGMGNVVTISAGASHTLFLKSDGTVWSVGSNLYGQLGTGTNISSTFVSQVRGPNNVGFLTGIIGVKAGSSHSLFLKNDGTVWACGYNSNGQLGDGTTTTRLAPVQVNGLTNIIALAGGGSHSLFLKNDGTAWACGKNFNGQLGDSTTIDRSTPVLVKGIAGCTAISAGLNHSLFLTNYFDLALACGDNTYGALGNNTTISQTKPVSVMYSIKKISAGGSHSLFLKNDSTVWACGRNNQGQLGDSTTTGKLVPVKVKNISGCVSIAGGLTHSLFGQNNGTYWSTGRNNMGQLGDGTTINRSVVVKTANLTLDPTITGGPVFSGQGTLHAGNFDFYLWSTGSTASVLSINTTGTYTVTVTDDYGCTGIATQKNIVNTKTIAMGSNSSSTYSMCSYPGSPMASGNNATGQLGNGTNTNSNTPVPVSGLTNVTSIGVGSTYALFLKSDSTVWACGENASGQLGDLTNINRSTPVQVWGLSGVTAVSAGTGHSLFLKKDGSVRACGYNAYGQLGNGTFTDTNITIMSVGSPGITTAISAGSYHSLFLKEDGTVWACGSNEFGQLGTNSPSWFNPTPAQIPGLSGIIAISAGPFHSLFLKKDGTVWGCGYSYENTLLNGGLNNEVVPIQLPNFANFYGSEIIALAAGYRYSLLLLADGRVIAGGSNYYGALSNLYWGGGVYVNAGIMKGSGGSGQLSGITSLSTGFATTGFLDNNGSAWGCGQNTSGQLGNSTNIDFQYPVQLPLCVCINPTIPTISASNDPLCKGSSTTLNISTGNLNSATNWAWYEGSCNGTLVGTGSSISVAPTATKTYYVRGEGGCVIPGNCASFTLTVKNLPTVTVTPSVDTVCSPTGSITLSASGNALYFQWSPAATLNQSTGATVIATPGVTTTYTVTGWDAGYCTTAKTVKIVVNPKPNNLSNTNITATGATCNWNKIGCATGYTLQYRLSTSSTWTTVQINTNTPTSILTGLSPSKTYNWKVRTKYSGGSSAYSTVKNFNTPALRNGVTDPSGQLSLFPNPTTGIVTISLNECENCNYQLKVFDILGNLVYSNQNKTDGQTKTIDLSHLAKGVYQLQVEYNGVTKNTKMIMQ